MKMAPPFGPTAGPANAWRSAAKSSGSSDRAERSEADKTTAPIHATSAQFQDARVGHAAGQLADLGSQAVSLPSSRASVQLRTIGQSLTAPTVTVATRQPTNTRAVNMAMRSHRRWECRGEVTASDRHS